MAHVAQRNSSSANSRGRYGIAQGTAFRLLPQLQPRRALPADWGWMLCKHQKLTSSVGVTVETSEDLRAVANRSARDACVKQASRNAGATRPCRVDGFNESRGSTISGRCHQAGNQVGYARHEVIFARFTSEQTMPGDVCASHRSHDHVTGGTGRVDVSRSVRRSEHA